MRIVAFPAALLFVALVGCSGTTARSAPEPDIVHAEASPVRGATFTLHALENDPGLLPPLDPAWDRTASLTLVSDAVDGTVVSAVAPATKQALAWARAKARRRADPPDYWVLFRSAEDGAVRYWVPVEDPRRVYAERLTGEDDGGIHTEEAMLDAGVIELTAPFIPRTSVVLYDVAAEDELPEPVFSFGVSPPWEHSR